MNSFIYLVFFAQLGLLTNAFPAQHEISSSSTPVVEPSTFQGITNIASSITDNLRNAAKTTMTISDLVMNGDTMRTRGFWSWLTSCFGGGGSKPAKQVTREEVILTIATTNDFNTKVQNSKTPFMVMYSFDGCGACNKVSPTIENYIVSLNGKMLYAKINVDKVNVPDKSSISSYPTTQIFHNGQASARYGPSDTQFNYKTLIAPYIQQ